MLGNQTSEIDEQPVVDEVKKDDWILGVDEDGQETITIKGLVLTHDDMM